MQSSAKVCWLPIVLLSVLSVDVRSQEGNQHKTAPPGPQPIPAIIASERSEKPEEPEEAEEEEESPFEDAVETDRDSFTPSTKTAGPRHWIVESSYSFADLRHAPGKHSFPELLMRRGIGERFEVRLGWNFETGGDAGNEEADVTSGTFGGGGEQRILYGLKAGITKQGRLSPESAVILQGYTPTGSGGNDTFLTAGYVWGWEFKNKWKLDSAFRFGTNGEGEDRFEQWSPSVVLRVPITERLATHAEYFGIFSTNKEAEQVLQFFSPGLHLLVTPNLEVGVRVGWGVNEQSARFFTNAGVGWRF